MSKYTRSSAAAAAAWVWTTSKRTRQGAKTRPYVPCLRSQSSRQLAVINGSWPAVNCRHPILQMDLRLLQLLTMTSHHPKLMSLSRPLGQELRKGRLLSASPTQHLAAGRRLTLSRRTRAEAMPETLAPLFHHDQSQP